MSRIFDNILTQTQVFLEDSLPENSQVDELDLMETESGYFRIVITFPYQKMGIEMTRCLPIHLLYEQDRLLEVLVFDIEGWIIEANDNNQLTYLNDQFYTFPDVDIIVERLQTADNRGGFVDVIFTNFAKFVAGQSKNALSVGGAWLAACYHVKPADTINSPVKDELALERRNEFFRALFPDNPGFAERIIGGFPRSKSKAR